MGVDDFAYTTQIDRALLKAIGQIIDTFGHLSVLDDSKYDDLIRCLTHMRSDDRMKPLDYLGIKTDVFDDISSELRQDFGVGSAKSQPCSSIGSFGNDCVDACKRLGNRLCPSVGTDATVKRKEAGDKVHGNIKLGDQVRRVATGFGVGIAAGGVVAADTGIGRLGVDPDLDAESYASGTSAVLKGLARTGNVVVDGIKSMNL